MNALQIHTKSEITWRGRRVRFQAQGDQLFFLLGDIMRVMAECAHLGTRARSRVIAACERAAWAKLREAA